MLQARLLRSPPLHEQTYKALRLVILTGGIGVGDRLIETQLAERFNVSRTPIREAIRRLQQESLLTTAPDGGIYVTRLSITDAIKLYECRIPLEQLAVSKACTLATPQQLKAMEQALEQEWEIASPTTSEMDSAELLDINCNFHQLIAISSDNPWLLPLLDQLSNQITLMRIQTLQGREDVLDIHAEHYSIYEAIARRDAKTAVQCMTEHLTASQARISQLVQPISELTPSQPDVPPPYAGITCPSCHSSNLSKNGRRSGKQNYLCKACRRQFLSSQSRVGYSAKVKQHCLDMHAQGLGFREIERRTGVNHNTVIRWVNQSITGDGA